MNGKNAIFVIDNPPGKMDKFHRDPTEFVPEITLDPISRTFFIKGNSRPEDVREIYSPVVEWLDSYADFLAENGGHAYSEEDPFIMEFDFYYFNSSTVKFLYDITLSLKRIRERGIPVAIAWYHLEEDDDMKEAGEDIAFLADIEFIYIKKQQILP